MESFDPRSRGTGAQAEFEDGTDDVWVLIRVRAEQALKPVLNEDQAYLLAVLIRVRAEQALKPYIHCQGGRLVKVLIRVRAEQALKPILA